MTKIYKWKDKVQKNAQLSFWGKAKICLRGLHLFCVLLLTRSANRLRSQHLETVPTPELAELVPSVFSVHSHGFCGGPDTFPRKNTSVFTSIVILSQEKKQLSVVDNVAWRDDNVS